VSSSKSADSAKKESKPTPAGGEDMVFLFVARDADMLIFESHIKKTIETAKF